MDGAMALRLLQRFSSFPIELLAPDGMHARALELANRHGLAAVYDAQYLAVAEMLNCPTGLPTSDCSVRWRAGSALCAGSVTSQSRVHDALTS